MKKVNYGHDAMAEESATVFNGNTNDDKYNAVADCPMSEKAIAYAFEELEPADIPGLRRHLTTCRYCADLIQDLRTADRESRVQFNRSLNISPALSDAIRRSGKRSWIPRIRMPDFSLSSVYPKIIGAFATACLVLIIVQYSLQDPRQIESYQPPAQKTVPVEKKATTADKKTTIAKYSKNRSKNDNSVNAITVKDRNFIDPFQPFVEDGSSPSPVRRKRTKRLPVTPLEKLDFSQLKLVGIVLSASGNKAMVEDAAGKGYVLQVGTYVGRNSGRVARILNNKVIIEEEVEDDHGKIFVQTRELKLNNP
jgi:type IV pilus assembly protein PilP